MIFMVASCVALAACAHNEANTSAPVNNAVEAPAALAISDKAMYAAEATFNVPAQAYVAADANGLLTVDAKAKAKPILASMYAALKTARTAYAIGNVVDFNAAVATLNRLKPAALAILPASK
jgi:hypothetical protein